MIYIYSFLKTTSTCYHSESKLFTFIPPFFVLYSDVRYLWNRIHMNVNSSGLAMRLKSRSTLLQKPQCADVTSNLTLARQDYS